MKPEVRLVKRKTWKLGLEGNRSRACVWRTGHESTEAGLALRSAESETLGLALLLDLGVCPWCLGFRELA